MSHSETFMRQLTTDPKTGYVEFNGIEKLSAATKVLFLKYLEAKPLCLLDACDAVGISDSTFRRHLQIDPVFAADVERLKTRKIERLEQTLFDHGSKPEGVADRIFALKSHKPEIYNPDRNINVNHNFNLLEKLSSEAKGYLDAEVVSESANKELAMSDNTTNLTGTSETR